MIHKLAVIVIFAVIGLGVGWVWQRNATSAEATGIAVPSLPEGNSTIAECLRPGISQDLWLLDYGRFLQHNAEQARLEHEWLLSAETERPALRLRITDTDALRSVFANRLNAGTREECGPRFDPTTLSFKPLPKVE